MHGIACFAGTRVAVQTFFDHLEAGYTIDGFLEQFPTVKREQVVQLMNPPLPAKALGDAGEELALQLLINRGYRASRLPVNAPTYDLEVSQAGGDFRVSVKVSRTKQHVRLGARSSVDRLGAGNFVFAFLPNAGNDEIRLTNGGYSLLILPADLVRDESLAIHDAYWAARGRPDGSGYSVQISHRHQSVWIRWKRFAFAWNVLPATG